MVGMGGTAGVALVFWSAKATDAAITERIRPPVRAAAGQS
jgi:hypothetical protein